MACGEFECGFICHVIHCLYWGTKCFKGADIKCYAANLRLWKFTNQFFDNEKYFRLHNGSISQKLTKKSYSTVSFSFKIRRVSRDKRGYIKFRATSGPRTQPDPN